MTSSRRSHLKSLVLSVAAGLLEEEAAQIAADKAAHLTATCGTLELPGTKEELLEYCKKLGQAADKSDDERYDTEAKVVKAQKEIDDLKFKVVELQPVKKPALKKVRMSADSMLQALLGTKHKVTMDLRSNLKTVKKEKVVEETGDWRANVDDKADRKKMFEA